MGHAARLSLPLLLWVCSSSVGSCSISSCFCREDLLADNVTNPLKRTLPDGIVPEDEVTRTEDWWSIIMLSMLGVMMAIIVVTGATHALHPPSNGGNHRSYNPASGRRVCRKQSRDRSRARRLGHAQDDCRTIF